MIEKIEGESGFYNISKVKVLYYLGFSDSLVYMFNLDTKEFKYERR